MSAVTRAANKAVRSPARAAQEDKQAGQRGGFDPSEGGDGGSYKEGGQNEQNTKR